MVYNNNKYLILTYTKFDGEVIKSFKNRWFDGIQNTVFRILVISIQNTLLNIFKKKYLKNILNTVIQILYSEYYPSLVKF
jgi:hypothetical protein